MLSQMCCPVVTNTMVVFSRSFSRHGCFYIRGIFCVVTDLPSRKGLVSLAFVFHIAYLLLWNMYCKNGEVSFFGLPFFALLVLKTSSDS